MPDYTVETRATVRRVYEVTADNEKDAIAKSTEAAAVEETDIEEETISVTVWPAE